MNQASDARELSSCDSEPQKKKVLHFSSGEILTESEGEDEHELHQTFSVSEQVRSDNTCFYYSFYIMDMLCTFYFLGTLVIEGTFSVLGDVCFEHAIKK